MMPELTAEERRRRMEALKLLAPADATKRTPGAKARPDPVMRALQFLAEIAPGTGEAMSAGDFLEAKKEGDKLGMVLGAAGAIPVGGSLVRGGKKATKASIEALKKILKTADEGDAGRKLLFSLDDLRAVPDVEQIPITTRRVPKRGVPADVLEAVKSNRGSFEDAVKRGLDKGGPEWYNLDPLRKDYIAELGDEAGSGEFARFTQHIAGSSPLSKVAHNIRRGSAFSLLNRHGIEVPDEQELLNLLQPSLGHIAHSTSHLPAARDIERFGSLAANDELLLKRPKTSSFGENLRGNYEPVTVDTHNARAWGLPEARIPAAYDILEKEQKDIAAKMGIRPAQVQSSAWIGAADETGVADARPFLSVFQDVLNKSADRQKMSPDELYKRFLRGTGTLGVAGMMGAGAMRGRDDGA